MIKKVTRDFPGGLLTVKAPYTLTDIESNFAGGTKIPHSIGKKIYKMTMFVKSSVLGIRVNVKHLQNVEILLIPPVLVYCLSNCLKNLIV